jgi:hypothetical protein
MPRLVHRLPVPRHHRPSGQARLLIGGREFWLGPSSYPEAQAEYDGLIAEYLAAGRKSPSLTPAPLTYNDPTVPGRDEVTITELVAGFWDWAQTHYRAPDGTPTREADNFRAVLRRLRRRYGPVPVAGFGPARLLEMRGRLVTEGLARHTINAMVRRVRQVFG